MLFAAAASRINKVRSKGMLMRHYPLIYLFGLPFLRHISIIKIAGLKLFL
jgi:hypothetical protein